MPIKPPVGCDAPGCLALAIDRSIYCEKHQPVREDREADRKRYHDQPWRALYNAAAWRINLRPFILARDPLCKLQITDLCKQHGGDASTVADHIRDHKGDPALFFEPTNLRGVCKPCHDRKTGMTRGGAKVHADYCLIRQNLGVCTCPVNDASVLVDA
jgi:5-methylcytosine-specific restriction protein A